MATITVFSDYETWETADTDSGIVAIIADTAFDKMCEGDTKFKHLPDNQILSEVSIRSLLDLWNKTYGTSF